MGFDENWAIAEKTSFKTKFLDYLTFRRPILVWGPEYCSAIKVAREFDSGECVTNEQAGICAEALLRLANSPERRVQLIENSQKMYKDRFQPAIIQNGLVKKIAKVIQKFKDKNKKR